jgi:cytochrome c-type protein NapC
MGTSTFSITQWGAIICAAIAALILVWYLVRRPQLTRTVKLALLLGIGVFPAGTALLGNYHGYEESRMVPFCGACHVMTPYTKDLKDPTSTTLASLHGRNSAFGDEACYACHRDYGMFGTVTTKLTGMKHAYIYWRDFKDTPVEEALPRIELYNPYPNSNCMQCHSTALPGWEDTVPEHRGLSADLRSGAVSCASEGCHGPAHPFAKPKLRHRADTTEPGSGTAARGASEFRTAQSAVLSSGGAASRGAYRRPVLPPSPPSPGAAVEVQQ